MQQRLEAVMRSHLARHRPLADSPSVGVVRLRGRVPQRTGRSFQLSHPVHRLPPPVESAGQRGLARIRFGPVLGRQRERTETSNCAWRAVCRPAVWPSFKTQWLHWLDADVGTVEDYV